MTFGSENVKLELPSRRLNGANRDATLYQINKGADLMNRSRNFILCGFLAGSVLSASAQQSAPAVPAPPPPVGTLAAHPDWPEAKNPGDVDTVDHLLATLYDVVSGPAGQRDWDRFRALFLPTGGLSHLFRNLRPRGIDRRARAMRSS